MIFLPNTHPVGMIGHSLIRYTTASDPYNLYFNAASIIVQGSFSFVESNDSIYVQSLNVRGINIQSQMMLSKFCTTKTCNAVIMIMMVACTSQLLLNSI